MKYAQNLEENFLLPPSNAHRPIDIIIMTRSHRDTCTDAHTAGRSYGRTEMDVHVRMQHSANTEADKVRKMQNPLRLINYSRSDKTISCINLVIRYL